MGEHRERTYRHLTSPGRLVSFRVRVKETDLLIHADRALETLALESVLQHRSVLESYIELFPEFVTTLAPWSLPGPAPLLIREMTDAGRRTGVGPMAAVAGAIAEGTGRDLLAASREVIVENGGDIFLKTEHPVTVGLYAGRSSLSLKVGLRIRGRDRATAVCTSSGTVGHSLSLGRADAVCVVSDACSLADAAATAIGNRIRSPADVASAIEFGKRVPGIEGLLVIVGEEMGLWGDVQLVPLDGKKG
jgi:uncharacterized protein